MLLHYHDAGFQINTRPEPQPAPPLAAGAIDSSHPSEVWNWRPDVTFPDQFHQPAALSFRCFWTVPGHRVFFPVQPWEDFVRLGARYGVAVLDAAVGPERGQYHAVMSMFAEKARHTDVYLSRHFGCLPDLQAAETDGMGVLPHTLGVAPGESRRGWTPRGVIAEGVRVLRQSGRPGPSTATCIAYGLYAAAVINPIEPPAPDRCPDAVRDALFADGDPAFPRGEIPEMLIEEVAVAIADTYRGRVVRRWDDPEWAGEDGLRRLAGTRRSDRLIGQLVGRVERRGDWNSAQIKEAIREWYWRSLHYVGCAFSAAVDCFVRRAEQLGGLTPDEVALFRVMYCCHSLYGGLALPILYDRFDAIEPWLERVVLSPTKPQPEILYTLLAYYALMVRERRAVDTVAARGEVCRTDHADGVASREPDPTEHVANRDEVNSLAGQVAHEQGYSCCDAPRWAGRSSDDGQALIVGCLGCGWASPPVSFGRVREIVGCHAA